MPTISAGAASAATVVEDASSIRRKSLPEVAAAADADATVSSSSKKSKKRSSLPSATTASDATIEKEAEKKKKQKKSTKIRLSSSSPPPPPPLYLFRGDADTPPRIRLRAAPPVTIDDDNHDGGGDDNASDAGGAGGGHGDDDDDDDGVEIVFAVAKPPEPVRPPVVAKPPPEPVRPVLTVEPVAAKPEPVKLELPTTVVGDLGMHSFRQPYMMSDALLHPLVEYHGGVAFRRRPQLTLAEPSDMRAPPNAAERERLTNDGEEQRVEEREHDVSLLADAARAARNDFATRTLWRKTRTGPTPPLLGVAHVQLVDDELGEVDNSVGDGGVTKVDEFIIAEFSALTTTVKATAAANAAALEAASSVSHGPAPTVPQRWKKSSAKRALIEQECPLCGWRKATSTAMLTRHVNACLTKMSAGAVSE